VRDHLSARGLKDDVERMERRPLLRGLPFAKPGAAIDTVARDWLHTVRRHVKLTGLEAEHARAAEALKGDASDAALKRLQEIDREIKLALGAEAGPPEQN
jgi:hypothetical protein